jgi:hypothetical protein
MTLMSAGVVLPAIAWAILLARLQGRPRSFLTYVAPAAALGLGTSSVLWWVVMLLPLESRTGLIAIDMAIWALACLTAWRIRRSPVQAHADPRGRSAVPWPAVALLVVAVVGSVVYFVAASVATPHGSWDAWAIWNARARFLFHGYPDVWTQAFSPMLDWSHPDYPLLLPVSVARAWTYLGRESVVVPIALAATFTAAILTMAATSVARAATAWRGVLTALMILASPGFLTNAVSQCADIPLAFYVLATCVLVGRATEADSRPASWVIAGVAVSLAAWTKNEGIAFALIAVLVYIVWAYQRDRWRGLMRIAPLLAGAAPGLAVLVAFKLFIAPPNDLMTNQSAGHVLSNLRDVSRLQIVAAAVGKELWFGGARFAGVLPLLALFVLGGGIRRPIPVGPALGLATAGALLGADVIVYILTPHDLAWQLSTSVQRVVVQVFPAIVWCAMSLTVSRAPTTSTPGF